MEPSVGGAAAVAGLFGALFLFCLLSFKRTHFRIYLLLGLSCAFRCTGYAVRAANLASFSNAKAGTYLALASAGYGVSLAVICLCLFCWWKNGEAGAGLRKLSLVSRLLIAPIIIFGPLCGAVLAGLIYGDGSPTVMARANTLRLAVSWGMLAVLIVLALISSLGLFLAWRGRRSAAVSGGKGGKKGWAARDPDLLVCVILACCALLLISASFRVAVTYHHSLPENDDVFYPVQVLPELLEVIILLLPLLMPRAALGAGFQRWWAATHGEPSLAKAASLAAAKAESLESGSSKAASEAVAAVAAR